MVSIRSITIQTSPVFMETSIISFEIEYNAKYNWWRHPIWFYSKLEHQDGGQFFNANVKGAPLHFIDIQRWSFMNFGRYNFFHLTFVVFTNHSSLNTSLLFSRMSLSRDSRIRTLGASWWQSGELRTKSGISGQKNTEGQQLLKLYNKFTAMLI